MVDRKNIAWRISTVLLAMAVVASFAWAQTSPAGKGPETLGPGAPVPELTTSKQKFSYGIGMQMGAGLKQREFTPSDLDMNAVIRGLTDALASAKPAITEQQMQKAAEEVITALVKKKLDAMKADPIYQAAAAKNKKEGEAFLAANKTKEGVKTLPSGLQYKVLASGKGATPQKTDAVVAHYHGTLVDGTVFDSSVKRNEPATFPVLEVIPGWTEALLLMKEGDKWQLVVPSDLAYGEMQRSKEIGPNSTLIFEVELLKVLKEPAGKPGK
jgi:FKBP-type peptidyl-prolyl cis-trans isomerase FklB